MISTSTIRSARGFSLIELLVVIGLIVTLTGGISLAWRAGNSGGVALQSARVELVSLLAVARDQAILHQTSACLLIFALAPPQDDAERYLHCLQIAREESSGSGRWISVGDPVWLPRGIFVVPPTVPATHLLAGVTWPGGQFAAVSTLPGPADFTLNGSSVPAAYYVSYGPDGRVDSRVTKLALATAQSSRGSFPRFDNPAAVRGVRLRPAGAIGLIDTAEGF